MLSESVAQKPIIAVSDGQNTGRNESSVGTCRAADIRGPRPCAAFDGPHDEHRGTTRT
jgi:hypothetical protein